MYTTECCSAIKNTVPPFGTTWMDLESIVLSEISQKGKYDMISLTSHRQRKSLHIIYPTKDNYPKYTENS